MRLAFTGGRPSAGAAGFLTAAVYSGPVRNGNADSFVFPQPCCSLPSIQSKAALSLL